jgi:hypothetical protein
MEGTEEQKDSLDAMIQDQVDEWSQLVVLSGFVCLLVTLLLVLAAANSFTLSKKYFYYHHANQLLNLV